MSDGNSSCGSLSSGLYTSPAFVALLAIFAFPTIFWLVSYLLPQIYMAFRPVPDLKKKYNAEWGLVSGAGSGIGKALAFKLAGQGLNVVLVSLDDAFLKQTMVEIQEAFPEQQFRQVAVNFAPGVPYMDKIIKATKDIQIPIVFCNAGFMVTGFVDQAPIEKLLLNIECNATSAVNIAHYFVRPLIANKKKGCIVFTSSVAGFIPTRTYGISFACKVPVCCSACWRCSNASRLVSYFFHSYSIAFAAMYASTKAFVSQFASCLHIEVKPLGIDVCAVHPSPVASNFYSKLVRTCERGFFFSSCLLCDLS